MQQLKLLTLILDSWNESVVLVDTNHIIQYMNAPARMHYAKWGNIIGKSIFDCHNPVLHDCRMEQKKSSLRTMKSTAFICVQ